MQKFFCRGQDQAGDAAQDFPESGKNRPQKLPHRPFPYHSADDQPRHIPQPQVRIADRKPLPEPGEKCTDEEQYIPQQRVPWPQRTQEAIQEPQSHPKQRTDAEPADCQRRGRHPKSLLTQLPVCRASS